MSFEPGYIPEGWKRGQPLRVMRAIPSWPGFITLDHARLTVAERPPLGATGLIRFTAEEAAGIDAWLAWWNAGDSQ